MALGSNLSAARTRTDCLICEAGVPLEYEVEHLEVHRGLRIMLHLSPTANLPGEVTQLADDMVFDSGRSTLEVKGVEKRLTQRESRILEHLIACRGRIASRRSILDAASGFDACVEERTVDSHICNLRTKMESPDVIRTVWGIGYQLDC